MARAGEDELIARFLAPLARDPGAFNLKDDAAVIAVPAGNELVLTTDMLVAGVHFFPDDPPDLIARKALRTNLSDLAAKGAEPRGYLLSLALPDDWTEAWLAAFTRGLGEDQVQFAIPLLGGDTTRAAGPLSLSITAFGLVPAGQMVRRKGARTGDDVFVSGTVGDSALGCALRLTPDKFVSLPEAVSSPLRQRYLLPQPRNLLAPALRRYASAAMDISDGLVGDLAKLCLVSGVGAAIAVEEVPLSAAATAAIAGDEALLALALTGGDDYELLCTAAPEHRAAFMSEAQSNNVALSRIGTILDIDQGVTFHHHGKPLTFRRGSFSHF